MTSDAIHFSDDDLGMNTLFVVLVLVTYLSTFASGEVVFITQRGLLFTACGVLFVFLGMVTFPQFEQRGGAAAYLHLVVQTLLAALIYYLSRGQGWLIMLPILGQSVMVLPSRQRISMLLLNLFGVMGVTFLLVDPSDVPGVTLSVGLTVLISGFQYALSAVFVVLFTLVAVREREARASVEELAQQLEAANAKLRSYTAQAEELAVVKERNRLAREIHDGLSHYLTAINMQIQAALAVLDLDRERGLKALNQAQALSQEGLAEVRRSVSALRASPLDDFSLPEAVRRLVEGCRNSGLEMIYEVEGEPVGPGAQAALVIYRAVQEGLTNVRKHAQAQRVEVRLVYDDDHVTLLVEDDGWGTSEPEGGFGLLGIRERLKLVDGQMRVETGVGQGFRLQVEVPKS